MHETLLIDKPGTFLGKKSRRVVVKTPDSTEEFPLLKIKEINLVGTGISLSDDLVYQAVKQEVQINFQDRLGRVYASIVSPFLNQTVATVRAQIGAEDTEKAAGLAKEIVLVKIANQEKLLRYFLKHQRVYYPTNAEKIGELSNTLDSLGEQLLVTSFKPLNYHNQLFSFEGRASDSYWRGVKLLIGGKVDFPGRKGRGAKDLVNSLLNYGYAILYSRVLAALLANGLLPFAGFLHKDRSGKSSLVLDIMEIFRQKIVDETLLIFLNKKKLEPTLDQNTLFAFSQKVVERFSSTGRFVDNKNYTVEKIISLQVQGIAAYLRGNKNLNLVSL
ncbi:MAG TPA: CRISPR-associated endonuclease Cas1 [Candidatus Nanoarchaeia archaeon]|nr:CRISPR-associated endonuclease Cas1 [uncultured archaeon]